MKRLIFTAVSLNLLIILVLSATLWFGRHQSPPELIGKIHFLDCELPCWIGISPQQTTLTDARRQLYSVFGEESVLDLSGGDYPNPLWHPFEVTVDATHQWLVRLELNQNGTPFHTLPAVIQAFSFGPDAGISGNPKPIPGDSVSLGDVLNLLGPPASIGLVPSAVSGSGVFALSFARQHLVAFVAYTGGLCVGVSPTQKVAVMRVFGTATPRIWALPPTIWQGFRGCYRFVAGS